MMQCTNCGMSNKPGARFCSNCGVALGGGTTLPLGAAVQGRYTILKLLGTEVGKHYLVMELVPGETLEERLARQGTP